MSATDGERFQDCTQCYLCDKPFASFNSKERDHCHLSGRFRRAAHSECNKQAKIPKHLVICFHNLTGYDGKILMKTIEKLQNLNGPYHQLPASEYMKQKTSLHNKGLVRWMKEHTEEWADEGKHEATWLRAIREIRKAAKLHSVNDFETTWSHEGVQVHGVGPVVRTCLARAPAEVWDAPSNQREEKQARVQAAGMI